MKKAFAFIGIIYLGIEFQAFMFLLEILWTPLSIEQLEHYERYGYASAGLGITLLASKLIWSQKDLKNNTHKSAAVLLTAPFIYLFSIWLVYEAIYQVPNLIPQKEKPAAFSSGVAHLSEPSLASSLDFYLNDKTELNHETVNSFLDKYPASDEHVRFLYLEGLRGLRQWDKAFKNTYEKMDKAKIDALVLAASQNTSSEEVDILMPNSISWTLWKDEYLMEYNSIFQWGRFIMRNIYLKRQGQGWPSMWLRGQTVDRWGRAKNGNRNLAVWDTMKRVSDSLPATPANPDDLSESIRIAHTQSLYEKAGVHSDLLIPWYQPDVSHREQQAYKETSESLVPFMFDEGEALININRLHDPETFMLYVDTLQRGMSDKLRGQWDIYQARSIGYLAENPERWNNPVEHELNKDVARIGVVLPWLVALSSMLILANGTTLARELGWRSAPLVGGVLTVTYALHKLNVDWTWLITSISIQKTQLFII
jgi:hypothetical protein